VGQFDCVARTLRVIHGHKISADDAGSVGRLIHSAPSSSAHALRVIDDAPSVIAGVPRSTDDASSKRIRTVNQDVFTRRKHHHISAESLSLQVLSRDLCYPKQSDEARVTGGLNCPVFLFRLMILRESS
jgi:hypothetical protein